MGYIIKDGITVGEPKIITLSGIPNFVAFSSTTNGVVRSYRCRLKFTSFPNNPVSDQLKLIMTIWNVFTCSVVGTLVESEAGEIDYNTGHLKYYYDASSMEVTAHNIKNAFLSFQEIEDNIDISILPVFAENGVVSGYSINFNPKFPLDFIIHNNANPEAEIIEINNEFVGEYPKDILLKNDEPEIKLDVYSDVEAKLGTDARPDTPGRIGTLLTSLRKTYVEAPLWFNLGSLFSQYKPFNLPLVSGWFDTGTCRAYRFSATAPALSEYPFYWSDVLYVLNGYGSPSRPDNMEEYVYSGGSVKLLSDKPCTTYVRGQREYLNFILGSLPGASQKFGVSYRAYTTGGALLGEIHANEISVEDLHTVNTCVLDIDPLLDKYPDTGIAHVALTVNGEIVSDSLEYEILPECLHQLRQFSFLNRLGGWNSINFEAGIKEEIKPGIEIYDKTLTPSYRVGDSLETVYRTSLSRVFTIEGAPVTNEVADWLKEFAASQVILDGGRNYVIIEDFTLPVSDDNYNMQKPTLKYRLSEPYD